MPPKKLPHSRKNPKLNLAPSKNPPAQKPPAPPSPNSPLSWPAFAPGAAAPGTANKPTPLFAPISSKKPTKSSTLDSRDDSKFAEELGDLLLQVLFHAQIAAEQRRFSIHDVIREIHDKMVRRHPHVFGKVKAKTSAQVLRNSDRERQNANPNPQRHRTLPTLLPSLWGPGSPGLSIPPVAPSSVAPASSRRAKRESASASLHTPNSSRSVLPSLLDGVIPTLPALLEGFHLTRKAARIGFDWENVDGVFDKLREESDELREALRKKESPDRVESELGDILFVAVNLFAFSTSTPKSP